MASPSSPSSPPLQQYPLPKDDEVATPCCCFSFLGRFFKCCKDKRDELVLGEKAVNLRNQVSVVSQSIEQSNQTLQLTARVVQGESESLKRVVNGNLERTNQQLSNIQEVDVQLTASNNELQKTVDSLKNQLTVSIKQNQELMNIIQNLLGSQKDMSREIERLGQLICDLNATLEAMRTRNQDLESQIKKIQEGKKRDKQGIEEQARLIAQKTEELRKQIKLEEEQTRKIKELNKQLLVTQKKFSEICKQLEQYKPVFTYIDSTPNWMHVIEIALENELSSSSPQT